MITQNAGIAIFPIISGSKLYVAFIEKCILMMKYNLIVKVLNDKVNRNILASQVKILGLVTEYGDTKKYNS